jgi:hypothetical protein
VSPGDYLMGKDRFNSQPQHASESTIGFLLESSAKKTIANVPQNSFGFGD